MNNATIIAIATSVVLLVIIALAIVIIVFIVYRKKHGDKERQYVPTHIYDTIGLPPSTSHAESDQDKDEQAVTGQEEHQLDDHVKYDDITSIQKAVCAENHTDIEVEKNEAYTYMSKADSDPETAL